MESGGGTEIRKYILIIPYILESDPHPFLQFQRAKKSDAD
jgi:hypothetical protein